MLILSVENLRHGASFGGPFYYDISTIENQDTVFPGLIDWYVYKCLSPKHNRVWDEKEVREQIKKRYQDRQKEIMEKYHKEKDYDIGTKLDSLIQIDLDKFKKTWEKAEEYLVLKDNKDWEKVLNLANWWEWEGLRTRVIETGSAKAWSDPIWDKKL